MQKGDAIIECVEKSLLESVKLTKDIIDCTKQDKSWGLRLDFYREKKFGVKIIKGV